MKRKTTAPDLRRAVRSQHGGRAAQLQCLGGSCYFQVTSAELEKEGFTELSKFTQLNTT